MGVRRTVFGTTAAASEISFGRLAGLGTSGWRGSLSAEGVKSGVQLPPKDAPLVGPFLSIKPASSPEPPPVNGPESSCCLRLPLNILQAPGQYHG